VVHKKPAALPRKPRCRRGSVDCGANVDSEGAEPERSKGSGYGPTKVSVGTSDGVVVPLPS